MLAYISNASLLCDKCGRRRIDSLREQGVNDNGDSDTFPQGPYTDGGGEADWPNHCDVCNVFLENPLTSDGFDDVVRLAMRPEPSETVMEWCEFYQLRLKEAEAV